MGIQPTANLTNAVFDNAIMTNANLTAANIKGASFRGVRLSGVNMENVTGAKSANFEDSCVSSGTVLPAGLSLENCFSDQ